jgi:AraC-like DNA-binding protein
LLVRIDREAPLVERVKRWLSSHPLQTRPTMAEVARDLGMSARSLRRHLSGQRVPYHDLVEDARSTRAKDLLTDPLCSVQEAAYALGFESPGAFTRAFKRWTGIAPTVFRAPREPVRSRRQKPAVARLTREKQTAARA